MEDISFSVMRGDCFGLLGPNGAGKTTIFRMLSAAIPADEGAVVVGGLDVSRRDHRLRLGSLVGAVMASDRTLYWRISGRENLRLYASLHGLRGRVAPERVEEMLHVVGLSDAADRVAGDYSTGMRQRLLIARALLPRPPILLLDEPTRSLDPIAAREFRSFVRKEVMGAAKCTVLVATHSDEEAFGLCDRVGFLDRGKLLAVGPIDEMIGQFSSSRYDLLTRSPDHPVFSWLQAQGKVSSCVVVPGAENSWARVQLTIPGDRDAASLVLDFVTAAGVRVGTFAHVPPSLADLIERVRHSTGGDVA